VTAFPELATLQRWFFELLRAPEGAARGAAELRRRGEIDSEDLSFLVVPDARLGAVERIDVYADMYFYRLRDSLAEDFPALAARIGSARFHNLITEYLLAHPPRHFSLRELGRALPGFLDAHPLARGEPALADLARLEWARLDVFDAADAAPLERGELLERASARPESERFALIPAARLLRLDAAAPVLWKRQRDASDPQPPEAVPGTPGGAVGVLVWRRDLAVFHRCLADDEERCLAQLARGASLAALGEALCALHSEEEAGPRLAALLERFAADGLLVSRRAAPA